MSVTTLIAAVRRRTGLSSSDAFAADTDITELLNEASASVATERDWPWLETSTTLTTANGTASYSVPADWTRTRTLQISGSDPMDDSRSRQELDGLFPTSTDTGQPQFFVITGDAIRLYPTPDGVYTVTHVYYRTETTLDDGADVPLMPAWAQGALVHAAAAMLFRRTNQMERANEEEQQYERWLKRLHDNARRVTGPVRVRVRSGGFI